MAQDVDSEAGEGNRAATSCGLGFVHPDQPSPRDPHHLPRYRQRGRAFVEVTPTQSEQLITPQPGRHQNRERVGTVTLPAVLQGLQPYQQIAQLIGRERRSALRGPL